MKYLIRVIFITCLVISVSSSAYSEQICQFYGTKALITLPDDFILERGGFVSYGNQSGTISFTYQMFDQDVKKITHDIRLEWLLIWGKKAGGNTVYYRYVKEWNVILYFLPLGSKSQSVMIQGYVEGDNQKEDHKKMLAILSTIRWNESIPENFEKVFFFSDFDFTGLNPKRINYGNIYFTSNGESIDTADVVYKFSREKNYKYSIEELKHVGSPQYHLSEFRGELTFQWVDVKFKTYEGFTFEQTWHNNMYGFGSFCIIDGYIYTVGAIYRNSDEDTALKDYSSRLQTFKVKIPDAITEKTNQSAISQ